jgi:hypothetical protein
MFDQFSSGVSHKAEIFLQLYPTPLKITFSIVSHNTEDSVLLWETPEKNDTTQNAFF